MRGESDSLIALHDFVGITPLFDDGTFDEERVFVLFDVSARTLMETLDEVTDRLLLVDDVPDRHLSVHPAVPIPNFEVHVLERFELL